MISVCLFAIGEPVLLTVRSVFICLQEEGLYCSLCDQYLFVCRRRACIAHCVISVCLFAGGGPVLLIV